MLFGYSSVGLYGRVQFMPGGDSELVPPDTIPNSEVKRLCADDSVGYPCESRTLPGSQSIEECCSFRAALL